MKGKLVVLDDLPKHLKQSLFEHGGEYPVVARYSSEPGDPGLDVNQLCHPKSASSNFRQDRIPQPRGFAMKVFNVNGKMFDAGKEIPVRLPVLKVYLMLSKKDTRY